MADVAYIRMHPIDSRLYGMDDLVVIKDEERANDDDEDADGIVDCVGSVRYRRVIRLGTD